MSVQAFIEEAYKHLQGQHNQKRHGYRYGSTAAAARSMRGVTDPAERAEYRKRAGMPQPVKRAKVEEPEPKEGGFAVKNSTLGSVSDNFRSEKSGRTIVEFRRDIAKIAQEAYERVDKNWEKPGIGDKYRDAVKYGINTLYQNKLSSVYGKDADFKNDVEKRIESMKRHLDDVARVVANQLQVKHKPPEPVDVLKPPEPKAPTRDYTALVNKIEASGKRMAAKFPGRDIYGKPFEKGANIIYSREGIILATKEATTHLTIGEMLAELIPGFSATKDAYGQGPEEHGSAWKADGDRRAEIKSALRLKGYRPGGKDILIRPPVQIDMGYSDDTTWVYITDDNDRVKEFIREAFKHLQGQHNQKRHGWRYSGEGARAENQDPEYTARSTARKRQENINRVENPSFETKNGVTSAKLPFGKVADKRQKMTTEALEALRSKYSAREAELEKRLGEAKRSEKDKIYRQLRTLGILQGQVEIELDTRASRAARVSLPQKTTNTAKIIPGDKSMEVIEINGDRYIVDKIPTGKFSKTGIETMKRGVKIARETNPSDKFYIEGPNVESIIKKIQALDYQISPKGRK